MTSLVILHQIIKLIVVLLYFKFTSLTVYFGLKFTKQFRSGKITTKKAQTLLLVLRLRVRNDCNPIMIFFLPLNFYPPNVKRKRIWNNMLISFRKSLVKHNNFP